ncbi:MAG: MBL fold metallo-hydrolase [Suipraeoptans sp.]
MNVTYLEHSGFVVELIDKILVFDYYKGNLKRHLKTNKDVFIFVSHVHGDHYNPNIFLKSNFEDCTGNVAYILSNDIIAAKAENIYYIGPDENLEIRGVNINTLKSTDEGVAFCVNCSGKSIYFAGDLNYWYWEEESDEYNIKMRNDYYSQIAKIFDKHFDIAFIPLDPRLGDQYAFGLDYFVRNTNTDVIFPMHMWGNYKVIDKLIGDDISKSYRNKIVQIKKSSREFEL